MDVYISADMEGITGTVAWAQCGRPAPEHYDWAFARRMMTHDVNAAVRGARAAGARRILVMDAHGTSRNLLVDELEPGVELLSGLLPHPLGMMSGLEAGFGCAMLVGYHAMAGTEAGTMEHTIMGTIHRFWINDVPAGEMTLSALTAGSLGVPLVYVSSDDKGCAEASSLFPGVRTTTVKHGVGRYCARLLHPSVTGPLIERTAREAVEHAAQVAPYRIEAPFRARIEYNQTEEADAACLMAGSKRTDAYTIELQSPDWDEFHRMVRRSMSLSGQGVFGNR
ncbi:MAG: M55 family metallopeptidase [Armatimonadetes bacterium]|nr:M55 family metallopeptidase [Armatimonadota bacterium]